MIISGFLPVLLMVLLLQDRIYTSHFDGQRGVTRVPDGRTGRDGRILYGDSRIGDLLGSD